MEIFKKKNRPWWRFYTYWLRHGNYQLSAMIFCSWSISFLLAGNVILFYNLANLTHSHLFLMIE